MAKRKLTNEEWFEDITELPDDVWEGCAQELKKSLPKGRAKPVVADGVLSSKWDAIMNDKREVTVESKLQPIESEDGEILAMIRTHVARAERIFELYRLHGYEKTLSSTPNLYDVEISLIFALLDDESQDERAYDLLGSLATCGEIDELVPYKMLLINYAEYEVDERKFVDALERISRLAESDHPEIYVDVCASLGLYFADTDHPDKAEPILMDLVRRFPDSVAAKTAYAQFCISQDRETEAVSLLKEALGAAESQVEIGAIEAIGQTLIHLGEMTEEELGSLLEMAEKSLELLEEMHGGERDFVMEAMKDHPEYADRLEHMPESLHAADRVGGVNPGGHLTAHAFVEHLLAGGGFPELNHALLKLTAAGASRHDAVHQLVGPLEEIMAKGADADIPAEWSDMITRLAERGN